MGDNFSIVYETLHVDGSRGEIENALKISDEDLKKRNVIIIDVANDPIEKKDYKPDEDPKTFKSEKTGRGPLTDPLWKQKCEPVMTCYKLVYIKFKWFGLQGTVEKFIASSIQNLFTTFHRYIYIYIIGMNMLIDMHFYRQLFCWTDKWYGLTIEDIRKIEEQTKKDLDEKRNAGAPVAVENK